MMWSFRGLKRTAQGSLRKSPAPSKLCKLTELYALHRKLNKIWKEIIPSLLLHMRYFIFHSQEIIF